MPSFDSIVVGEDWISEHFFTTDSTKESFQAEVIKLRKSWDEQAKVGHPTTLSRFSEVRGRLQILLAGLAEDPAGAREAYALIRTALGFKGTTAAVTFERSGTETLVPGVWKTENADVMFLEADAADAAEDVWSSVKPFGCVLVDGKEAASLTVAKVVSEIFLAERSPKYVVIMAGRWLVLTEQERWAEGRYLAADALLVTDRNDNRKHSETDRFLAIFGRDSLLPAPDGSIWWDDVLAASVKHTVGVSQDLREGIRRSVEIIANDVLKRRAARGLPVDEVDGQDLARQSLRFLYRILFLLYAEASPEMGVLPIGAGEYNEGYGLDRLRELTLVNIQSQDSQRGTHIYESLERLFRLVDGGHKPRCGSSAVEDPTGENEGLVFQPLKADLFQESATSLINDAKLSNSALQRVLQHLFLSKEARGKDRGFISYAELGINQLGAVYEGLMSYTGFIAAEPLYEVAKDGNPEKGSWVVPVDRSESIDARHFVKFEDELTGEKKPVLHETGSFVFRLAGRERQQSASFYTPEVLTKFVVSQALEELLDQGGTTTAADDVLKLTVCEPALGSGAFAIEAVRQLADEYLKRKQKELDHQIPADEYPQELQKVKAQIALHQVHGVDLNTTAVELAEVSLWLDTMVKDLQAPWFGLRLRRGNSLIGSRRATYSRQSVNDKTWLKAVPDEAPLTGLVEAMKADGDDPNVVGRIHQFLLPAEGWGSAAEAKEVKNLAAEAQKELKVWRTKIKAKPSKTQLDRLVALGHRVEALWKLTLRRLQVAETEARRDIDYFGKRSPKGEPVETPAVSREQIERSLNDENGSYQRLRRVMDAWNALWFWPLTERVTDGAQPPSLEEWISALEGILGVEASVGKVSKKYGLIEGQTSVLSMASWGELEAIESFDLSTSQAKQVSVVMMQHQWLNVCENIATDQGFFHWELDFASVFGNGGFNLQVGNPPWFRPEWDDRQALAEFDPWWQLRDRVESNDSAERKLALLLNGDIRDYFINANTSLVSTRERLTTAVEFIPLQGMAPDLYRFFVEQTWRHQASTSSVGLIHPSTHLTDRRASIFRKQTYRRIRQLWHFINEKKLFEIGNTREYSVCIYGREKPTADFVMASSMFHPDTIQRSIAHDGSGPLPGLKDPEGDWDLRPHQARILRIDKSALQLWADLSNEDDYTSASVVFFVNQPSMLTMEKLTTNARLRSWPLFYSGGWSEDVSTGQEPLKIAPRINSTWDEVIYQGPHISVAQTIFKQPNPTLKNHRDWSEMDLEALEQDSIPRTGFQNNWSQREMTRAFGSWSLEDGSAVPIRWTYRVAWRRMAGVQSVRTLQAALIGPGVTHTELVHSAGMPSQPNLHQLAILAGLLASLPIDFWVKCSRLSNLRDRAISDLPTVSLDHSLIPFLVHRAIRLNALHAGMSSMYEDIYDESWATDRWSADDGVFRQHHLGTLSPRWAPEFPLRLDALRRLALIEIDVIVAIMLGLSADDLVAAYYTQFPVLVGYEKKDLYDANGRKVPGEINRLYRKIGENLTHEERTYTHPQSRVAYVFEFPFHSFDREEDMRKAYAHFSSLLGENS